MVDSEHLIEGLNYENYYFVTKALQSFGDSIKLAEKRKHIALLEEILWALESWQRSINNFAVTLTEETLPIVRFNLHRAGLEVKNLIRVVQQKLTTISRRPK